ncbi:hypothetical protein CTI12_AA163530 [Artemisia annua]|uniref:AT3G52170-like helix-turn-helix domain-containing protein n=1 Tax=Artemisia annua TaxID=35608 RepID=A0A2U1PDN9_ARTAN|nr:hypothetical protein CTI12_AA163530 [Artemisia annua]
MSLTNTSVGSDSSLNPCSFHLSCSTRFTTDIWLLLHLFPGPMHVCRGGWSGQTFALAKFDDSFEGKKSGVRRSKQERKGMAETFIKRYQKANNGDFPSLNLTRKEVGGSFYMVREIVREIIQENLVLGPPKSPPGDQAMENLDCFLEDNPLGSISVGTQTLPGYEYINDEVLNTSSITELHQRKLDSNYIDGEHKGDEVSELVTIQTQKHQILDVEVGRVTSAVHDVDETSNARETLDGDLEKKDTENMELPTGNNGHLRSTEMHLSDNSTDLVDVKLEEEIANLTPESTPILATPKVPNHSSTEENLLLDVNDNTCVKLEDTLPAEEKIVNSSNAQNLHSKTSGNSAQHRTLDERSANLNKSSDQSGANSKKRTNATLNRINLESWKAASKKSNGQETHQLVKFIKSFITAFVKFWTE